MLSAHPQARNRCQCLSRTCTAAPHKYGSAACRLQQSHSRPQFPVHWDDWHESTQTKVHTFHPWQNSLNAEVQGQPLLMVTRYEACEYTESPAVVCGHGAQRPHAWALSTPAPRAARRLWAAWAMPSSPPPPCRHASAARRIRCVMLGPLYTKGAGPYCNSQEVYWKGMQEAQTEVSLAASGRDVPRQQHEPAASLGKPMAPACPCNSAKRP